MSNEDNKNPPVFDHDTDIPYADRSIRAIVWIVVAILLVGVFAGWYFYGSINGQGPHTNSQQQAQMPNNPYEEESGRSFVYDFFYKMFGGVENGLEESPNNLDNAEAFNNLSLDTGAAEDKALAAKIAIEEYAEERAQKVDAPNENNEYRHSVFDVVGSEIYGRQGKKSGEIFDIMVQKDTGKAQAVVVNEDESRFVRDITSLDFKKGLKQKEGGAILLTVAEEKVEDKSGFRYADMDTQEYVSLRHLRDGQLIDFEGEVAGQIDAVIYENAEAQTLYFTLRPALAQQGAKEFRIPFEEAKIVENRGGYDIQLTEAQTAALAKLLFQQEEK